MNVVLQKEVGDEKRRRRRRREDVAVHKHDAQPRRRKIVIPSGPLLIVRRRRVFSQQNVERLRLYLCRLPTIFMSSLLERPQQESSPSSSSPFAVLRYDTAIQVVATRRAKPAWIEKKNAEDDDGRLCVDSTTIVENGCCWERRYLSSIYPISNIEGEEETTTTNAATDHVVFMAQHNPQSATTRTTTPTIREKGDGNEDDDDDDFVGIFSSPPTPLLSVAFSIYADPPLLWTAMSSTRLALLQSCLKRQLVACPLIWKDDHDDNKEGGGIFTTQVTLENMLDRTWTLQVESITAVGRRSSSIASIMGLCSTPHTTLRTGTTASAHSFGALENILFTILPSTRITLNMTTGRSTKPSSSSSIQEEPITPVMSTTTNKEQKATIQQQEQQQQQQHVSPTSRLLAETLHCCSRFTSTSILQPAQQQGSTTSSLPSLPTIKTTRGSGIDIPRSFLLSGPPGVGKSFAVQMAISFFMAQQQASLSMPSSSSSSSSAAAYSPQCHFVSLRGSDILAETATSANGSAGGGGAAIALQRHFDGAIHWLQKDDASRMLHAAATATETSDNGYSVALIFLDECDALLASSSTMSDSTGSSNMTAAMLAFLLDCMNQSIMTKDNIGNMNSSGSTSCSLWKRLVVVAATNRIDSIPATLRRPGRFDCEIPMGPPNVMERVAILSKLLGVVHGPAESSEMTGTTAREKIPEGDSGFTISPQELFEVAADCVGYVAADLAALVRRATLLPLSTISEKNDNNSTAMVVTADCLRRAMSDMVASALRDASLHAPPTTTWNDIAGTAGGAKTALRQAMEWPRLRRDAFRALGLQPPRGILLFGPPGCAKSTLARAAAGTAGVAFLSLSPADVYASSYVGEAEAVVRRAFCLARSAAPCVLFFDEIDAILGCNDDATSSSSSGGMSRNTGSSAEARVLSTFLNEMDGIDIGSSSGLDATGGVLVLGATNRPWTLDTALLRPGRFDKKILVPPPDWQGRREILEMQTQKWTISGNCRDYDDAADRGMNLDVLADKSTGMTGAEIVGACQSASHKALCEVIESHKNTTSSSSSSNISIRIDDDPAFQHRQQELLLEALHNVKPLLVSNPSILQDFELFQSGSR
jgi:SpoVK/Ycf46/Vps4 family AAA+-type ATPase